MRVVPVVLLPLGRRTRVHRLPRLGLRATLLWQLSLLALAVAGLTAIW
jgi:hypothetical protein